MNKLDTFNNCNSAEMSKKAESRLDLELHSACVWGYSEKIRKILATGRVYVDCKDKKAGMTPMMLAIDHNHYCSAMVLLFEGADPNLSRDDGMTPLMLASQKGMRKMVRDLVAFGADVDASNQDGGTALMFACQWGSLEVVQELIECGCNIYKAMQDGTTALFLACQCGHAEIVAALLSACTELQRNIGILIAAPRRDGATSLFIAAQMGHVECARILLKNGAEVDQSRIDDVTPLFKACHKGHLEMVKLLMKYNANVGVLQNGESCLHAAALSGDLWTVRELLRLGVDANVKNRDGLTAFDLSTAAGYDEIARLLKLFMRSSSAPPSSLRPYKSSLSSSSSDREISLKQIHHVRFKLSPENQWRKDMKEIPELPKEPKRVQCKLVNISAFNSNVSKANPVRVVWKHLPKEIQPEKECKNGSYKRSLTKYDALATSPDVVRRPQFLCFDGRTY